MYIILETGTNDCFAGEIGRMVPESQVFGMEKLLVIEWHFQLHWDKLAQLGGEGLLTDPQEGPPPKGTCWLQAAVRDCIYYLDEKL